MGMTAAERSHGRYFGKPDLALTSAVIAAGGGPKHFDAKKLVAMLAGQHAPAEFAVLTKRFGKRRVVRFIATFDGFVDDAIAIVRKKHIAMPRPQPALAHDSTELADSLVAAGRMPDGRFDVGYMLEHMLSRPMHIALMHEADASPAIGPAANADFHVILTSAMHDLAALYKPAR